MANLINYSTTNVFFTPAFWFLDDSVFSSVEHDIVLEIYDPTQNEIMNLNVMRETTDRPDNEVFNYTSLFDTEKTLHMLSQNFVLNKPDGFQVFNTNSHSTSGVVLTDSVDYFIKRLERMMEWVKSKPVTYSIEIKDLDVTRVDNSNSTTLETTLLTHCFNTHTVFTQRPLTPTGERNQDNVVWFLKTIRFYLPVKMGYLTWVFGYVFSSSRVVPHSIVSHLGIFFSPKQRVWRLSRARLVTT